MDYLKEESGVRSISKMYNQNNETWPQKTYSMKEAQESHGDTALKRSANLNILRGNETQ